MRRVVSLAAFLLVPLVASHALAVKGPEIMFDPMAVIVADVTPHGQVALFSVARESGDFAPIVARREAILSDDDGDGRVQFALPKGVAFRSVWVAVDLTSGEFAAATPASFPLRELKLASGKFKAGLKGKQDSFEFPTHFLEVFVARPGVGAWVGSSADGDDNDDDGPANGSVSTSLEHMKPVGSSPTPPDEFRDGDVVVVIDPSELQVGVVQIKGGKK